MNIGKCNLTSHCEVSYGRTVKDAANCMKKNKTRTSFITKNGIPMGLISAVDIINEVVATGKNPAKTKVESVMRTPLHACHADDSVVDAYFKMAHHNLVMVPVLKGNKIIGVLTAQEVMKQFIKHGGKHGTRKSRR